jgi:hypothetical protein
MLNCQAACLVDFLGLQTKVPGSSFTLAAVTGCLIGLFPLEMQQASLNNWYHLCVEMFLLVVSCQTHYEISLAL